MDGFKHVFTVLKSYCPQWDFSTCLKQSMCQSVLLTWDPVPQPLSCQQGVHLVPIVEMSSRNWNETRIFYSCKKLSSHQIVITSRCGQPRQDLHWWPERERLYICITNLLEPYSHPNKHLKRREGVEYEVQCWLFLRNRNPEMGK